MIWLESGFNSFFTKVKLFHGRFNDDLQQNEHNLSYNILKEIIYHFGIW